MSVRMEGGQSGDNKDYRVPSPAQTAQPVLKTETYGAPPSPIHFQALDKHGTHPKDQATADFMPTGGTNPIVTTNVGSSAPLRKIKGQMP